MVSYSNDEQVLTSVHAVTPLPPFEAKLYPNPASKQLTISTDYDKGAVSVLIVNMHGQEMMYFTVEGERTVDISTLAPGVYIVKMLGGGVVTEKIVVR